MPELFPCPFCDSKNVEDSSSDDRRFTMRIVKCNDCGSKGPEMDTSEQARLAWNERNALKN